MKPEVEVLFESRFIKLYGLQYRESHQYLNASRRCKNSLVCLKDTEEFKSMLPDAVSMVVIINGETPKILMNYEFRYPLGQFVLSVPAGLIDKEDTLTDDPLISACTRELLEETNISEESIEKIRVINPLLFSSPGMTDESNALVEILVDDNLNINQNGIKGCEMFDGFTLLTKEDALRIIRNATDDKGIFYSVYTFSALMYFLSDMWRK